LSSDDKNSGIYESADFHDGIPSEDRRETQGAHLTPNKFGKSKKSNPLYDSMDSGSIRTRKGSVLNKSTTNTKENDKACCEKGCLIF